MPLRESYGDRYGFRVPVHSVWLMWAAALLAQMNRALHGKRYVAHLVANGGSTTGGLDASTKVIFDPPGQPLDDTTLLWMKFTAFVPPQCGLLVKDRQNDMKVVGAIEFVLPTTKSKRSERRAFMSKCVAYLTTGIGLVIVDAVPTPRASLHNVLMNYYRAPRATRFPDDTNIVASYKLLRDENVPELMICPRLFQVGEHIPSVPLQLLNGPEVMLDLETAYTHGLSGLNL